MLLATNTMLVFGEADFLRDYGNIVEIGMQT